MGSMKSVIEKALRRGHDLPIEEQAELVERYLEIAQDLAGPAPKHIGLEFMGMPVATDATMPKNQIKIVTPDQEVATAEFDEPAPLPSRLGARPTEVNKLMRNYRSVEEILSHLEANAPPRMAVAIDGAPAPMELVRRIEAHEPMEMVKLTYVVQGGSDGPSVIFCTTDEKIGLADKLQQIRDAVRSQYSATPRQVRAKPARVIQEGQNMVGGEASDHEGISTHWNDPVERK